MEPITKNQNYVQSGHISIQIDDQNHHKTNENAAYNGMQGHTPLQPLPGQGSSAQHRIPTRVPADMGGGTQYASGQGHPQMFMRSAGEHGGSSADRMDRETNEQLQKQLDALGLGQLQLGQLGKSSSSKIIQIINNYNVNINNNYNPDANGAPGGHPLPQMHGQHAQPGGNGGLAGAGISVSQNPGGHPTHQLQNQQTLPNIVIAGAENMTEQELQERLAQELQRLQVHGNYHQSRASSQVPGRLPPQKSQASVVDSSLHASGGDASHDRRHDGAQQQRLSMATMGSHNAGDQHTLTHQPIIKKGYPGADRMQAQQSQESFLPYEENRRKRHDLAHGGLSHPSSGKSNNSSVNTTQKLGAPGMPRAATSNNQGGAGTSNPFPPHVGGSVEGVGGLLAQGSVGNGLQYSQNYQQPPHTGQGNAPFRRKASNTNKQSLTQLKNQSLQHEDEIGTPGEGSTEALNRHMVLGFSSQGIDIHGSSSGGSQPHQGGMYLNSESLGARGGAAAGDKTNSGSIQLAQIKVNKQPISGTGPNHGKGGGTFVAPKGLASVSRGGNKYINSKNANAGKGQFTGGPLHQSSHQSNSLGRDSLKSAGGIVNFDQSIGSGISGSQGPVPQGAMVGLISQPNPNGPPGQKGGTAQYSRPSAANGLISNGNSYQVNEFRDNSKPKHSEEMGGQFGNSQPRKYDSFEDENPYLPYQNQTMKISGTGTNSSTMNSRLVNQLQSSLNSGLGSLAAGGSFVGGPQAMTANNRPARDNSGASHNINGGKSVGPPAGDDLNGSQNSNMNMKLVQDHAPATAMPKLLNKNGNAKNGDYNNNSNKGSLNSFKGANYNRKMSPDKSIPMISKQLHQQYSLNQPSNMMGQHYVQIGQSSSNGDTSTNNNQNLSPPRINILTKNQAKNKFDGIQKQNNGREGAQNQGSVPAESFQQHLVNHSQNFQNSASKDNGRMINRSLNKGGINSIQDRMQERQKYENGSQISSTSNFNKALAFALPATSAGLNSKNSGTNSVTIHNQNNRGGTNHNKHRGGITQNNFDKCNPVCNDEDDLDDDAVYEMEEFETVDHVAHNYGQGAGQEGQQRGQSGAPGTNNSQNMGNNTFYAGQNTKFFDKRILASQKQNRPKNTFGPAMQSEIDQSSQGHSGYSPHIKQQKQSKKAQNSQAQRAAAQGGAVLPSVNESSVLPSLSRTGNNFNPNPEKERSGKGVGGNGQRVASRRTSTRQKADMQGARIIHSRQRQEQFMNEHPQNVYTLNMNTAKISPDQSHSKIPFSSYNHSQPRGQTQGSMSGHTGSMTHKINNKNSFKIKQLPVDYNQGKDMENEAREHLNLAQYNFNRMAVIDEEGDAGHRGGAARRSTRGVNDQLMSAGQDRRGSKNMHNTTTNFYPQRFGDRLPTRGDVQSRGRQNLIPSAQGTRRGNSRAENSFGRVQQMQINQAQTSNKGGTHYGSMFQESTHKSLIGVPGTAGLGLTQPQNSATTAPTKPAQQKPPATADQESSTGGRNASIGIAINSENNPLQLQNKSRIRISTESMQNINNNQTVSYQAQPYQANTVSAIREQSAQPPSSQGKGGKNGIARRNSQMNERDSGSIGRVSGALNSGGKGAYKGQQSGMNIGNFDDFDQYSNGNNGNQYDHGFDPPTKLDSGRGVSSGFNKNSAVDGFSLPHNHMFDIEEDNEDQFNDQQYQ